MSGEARRLKRDVSAGFRQARWVWYFALYLLPTVAVALILSYACGWDLAPDSNPPWYAWLFSTAAALVSLYFAGARLGVGDLEGDNAICPEAREYWLGMAVLYLNYAVASLYILRKSQQDPTSSHAVSFRLGGRLFTLSTDNGRESLEPEQPSAARQKDALTVTYIPRLRVESRRP